MKKITTEDFIKKSKKIHGDKYFYENSIYVKSLEKIIITCKEHGDFYQKPNDHLSGSGCPKCAKNKKSNTQEFIIKANEIHNNKYGYSEVNYKGWNNKIDIICEIHGIFKQTPNNHLNGKGCNKCGGNKKLTNDEFIYKAKKIHNELYDYSQVKYINTEIYVKIICKEHGIFEQKPYNHLLGRGCPICKSSKGELRIMNFLSKNNIQFIPQKTFEGCKYKLNLAFDFYLIELNTCIEFDGEQHFKSNKHFGGEKKFELTKVRDDIKNRFCEKTNIKLIRIPYWDFENIEYILSEKKIYTL